MWGRRLRDSKWHVRAVSSALTPPRRVRQATARWTGLLRLLAGCQLSVYGNQAISGIQVLVGVDRHFAPAAAILAIKEGIETGLSAQQRTGIAAWAALSIGGKRGLILSLPPLAREVIISAADDDATGYGQKASRDTVERFRNRSWTAFMPIPVIPGTDFNEVLRERGVLATRLQVHNLEGGMRTLTEPWICWGSPLNCRHGKDLQRWSVSDLLRQNFQAGLVAFLQLVH